MFYVYILKSRVGRHLYIGCTNDLRKRARKHNQKSSVSTRPYAPWELVYYDARLNNKDAVRRERYLKTTQGQRLIKRRLREYFYTLNH
ncbi:MAG TPA: GIY-YIG nuclease family protein [Candidatus Paceibacterota bacterium]